MQIQGIVNPPANASVNDGLQPIALMGKAAELIVAELHAKYYTTAYRGTGYIGSAAGAGVVPPIYTTTAQTFGIWNRAGNTRNAVLQTLDVGVAVFGAQVIGNLCLSQSLNAGSALATGGISAFTAGTPSTAVVGSQAANTVSFAPGAATTLATTFLMSLNYSFFSTAAPTGGAPAPCLHYDFEGGVIVPPNVAIWLASAPAAQSATFNPTLRWEEPPL
jgi:hypothetical protein